MRVHLILGNILSPLWLKICALGHIYIDLNAKILSKNNSHLVTLDKIQLIATQGKVDSRHSLNGHLSD